MKQNVYQQLVWDYNLAQDEFEEILSGKKKNGNLDQDWAISRILSNLNYYDAMHLIPYSVLKKRWSHIKGKLFNKTIQDGYEFLLHRYPVSITG